VVPPREAYARSAVIVLDVITRVHASAPLEDAGERCRRRVQGSATTSTLISGDRDAILVDALPGIKPGNVTGATRPRGQRT
jgi:hypothetical protein